MTARILVVDDIPTNVRLLEARLMAEYFQVLTADNGPDAIRMCREGQCDLVLLDVMMPGMDGFEVCRRLKQDPSTMHLPVVMVTALDQTEDRVRGLEAGADDFLTKPVNDLALVTRVKSLVRLKMLTDDLRMRAMTGSQLAFSEPHFDDFRHNDGNRRRVVVVDDRASSYERVVDYLCEEYDVQVITNPNEALISIVGNEFDLAVVSLSMEGVDSLRLCSHLRSVEKTRNLPLLVMADMDQEQIVSRALEIGVNDYIRRPIDQQELLARSRTQIRRKHYNDCLRNSVQQTIELAVKDPLTGLHNRRYHDSHYANMFDNARRSGSGIAAIMCDIDHFKAVNDTYGHDAGDQVIREVASRITKSVREVDLASRFGGEEFVIIMPDTDVERAEKIAERIRLEVEAHPVQVAGGSKQISITMSMGVSSIDGEDDTPERLMKRADVALYTAKRNGRNRIVTELAA
ncbi:MAG: PleD family two-component system response regulator [Rhizobiaceae bacterium]|nr:PleD family two-component system response regulator [Rhizobiaceae bacterium]